MSRYLLTGATGSIGSRVGEWLLAEGHDVAGRLPRPARLLRENRSWAADVSSAE
jgi:nucleoside-diphosphate-sugar epimerase